MFVVALVITLAAVAVYFVRKRSTPSRIPGPERHDQTLGNLPDMAAAGGVHLYLMRLHSEFGPILKLWWGTLEVVSVATPSLFKECGKVFDRPVELYQMFGYLFKDSLMVTNGNEARRRHGNYSKFYSQEEIGHYYQNFHETARVLIQKWNKMPTQPIEITPDCSEYSMKNLFQNSFGSIFEDPDVYERMRRAYDETWADMESRLTGNIPEPGSERETTLNEHRSIIHAIMKEAMTQRSLKTTTDHLLIDRVLEENMPDDHKMGDLILIMLGAIHTTVSLLVWAIYYLAEHQDVQERAHDEILEILGENDLPDPQNSKHLEYLQQIINESLRCSCVVSYTARQEHVEIVLGGHRIPAKTPIIQALGVVMQDPAVFANPRKFDPDRFTQENCRNRSIFAFQPFGFAGKRKCPGYQFGVAEVKVLLAMLIRSFKIYLVPDQVVVPNYGLVIYPKNGIWITISKRE